jgi:hypothetical protein
MKSDPTGPLIPAWNRGFCRKIAASNVEPERGRPDMKWMPFCIARDLRASCRNAEMAWFLHAGASSGGEREGLAVEEADESVSGQGGHAEHQMT